MRFARIVEELVHTYGSDQALADTLSVNRTSIREWRAGRAVPYVDTLVRIADVCGLDRSAVLDAAGKPPLEQLRTLLATDPASTLAVQLNRFRTDNGYDTAQAAAAIGIDRWRFSRFANGSVAIQSLAVADQIGSAIGTGLVETLLASGVAADHRLVREAIEQTSGFAGWFRHHARVKGYRTFDSNHVRLIAAAAQLTESGTEAVLRAGRLPDIIDAQKISRFAGVGVDEVLVAAGWDPAFATKVAEGLTAARAAREYEPLAVLVRSYRVAQDRTIDDVATTLGVDRSTVSRWESGNRVPDVVQLVRLSETTHAPLPRLLRAAKLVA